MRRRLWLLDLTLVALIALAGTALRQRWLEGRSREEALLKQMVPVAPPPVLPPLPGVAPSAAAQYNEVAQLMLFSRDRNPNVILDPPPAPPPPKPMPNLPLAYGVLNLGGPPLVIMSEKPGAQHRGYRQGEKIGEFTIHSFNNYEIVLEWEGKYVKRKIEEMSDRKLVAMTPANEPPPAAAAPPPSGPTNLANVGNAGPGADNGNQTRACVPGDTTPPGTVQDGFRKVVSKTPFGDSCRWEPAK